MTRKTTPLPVKLTRPPYERMSYIHDELKNCRYPNCSRVARQFEVSTKTIQRDIDFMRDRMGLPIEYDQEHMGFRYTKAVENLPMATISEGELVALLVAQKAIEQYSGTSFEAPLTQAFAKLTNQLDGPVTVALGAARALISFKPVGIAQSDLKLFQKLSDAVLQSFELEFDYRSLRSAQSERRRVQPWQLCCVDNQWYVIGHDLDREAKRTFALPRIRGVKVTKRRFVRPADFSIQEHLGSAFGVFTGTGEHVIRLRFSDWAARLVRERFWHESQRLTDGPDETIDLELRLGSLEEIERWILSFGEHVEVVSPASLRKRIASLGRRISRKNQ